MTLLYNSTVNNESSILGEQNRHRCHQLRHALRPRDPEELIFFCVQPGQEMKQLND